MAKWRFRIGTQSTPHGAGPRPAVSRFCRMNQGSKDMQKVSLGSIFTAVFLATLAASTPARSADDYTVDTMHAGITFKISHIGLSQIPGRFNQFSGDFTIDSDDPGKCSFSLAINTESIDTNNPKRDAHLKSPDFF